MKKLPVIVLMVLSTAFAAYADAATPKKRSRSANRIGAYAGALIGYSTYSDDQRADEQFLEAILGDAGAPIQGELSSSTEDSDIGYQALFGYRFHRFFAAELGLAQFGSLESTARGELDFGDGFVPTSVKLSFTVSGPIISAIGILPLHEKFELFARLGYMFTHTERELSARIDGEPAGSNSSGGGSQDPVYGAGFAWNINQMYSIRGEFQKLDSLGEGGGAGQENLNVIGLGLIIRF
jgi:opacity protein-like surface antigen